MQLEIIDNTDSLDIDFGQWLIPQIRELFFAKVDKAKLKRWDEYLNNSSTFKSVYKKHISSNEILLLGIQNLVCKKAKYKISIMIDGNRFIPGLDRIKIESACKLINYGNQDMKGYPIITQIFDTICEDLPKYFELYVSSF